MTGAPAGVRAQNALPDGEAKEAVQAVCAQCHQIGRVTGMSLSREDWKNTVEDMVRMGAQVPPEWVDTIVEYLALNFPEKPRAATDVSPVMQVVRLPDQTVARTATVADSTGHVWFTALSSAMAGRYAIDSGDVRTFPLPPAAVAAADPVLAADGMLWFAVTHANLVGRLDPNTGAARLIQMPRAQAAPCATAADAAGVPYFIEQGSNRLVAIDPNTLTAREITLPKPEARPRSIAIGPDQAIWYLDGRGYVGRFDPGTREAAEWQWQGGQAPPSGIAVTKRYVWSTECNGTSCTLVRFDPSGAAFVRMRMPNEVTAVTRLVGVADNQFVAVSGGSATLLLVTGGSAP